MLLDDAASIKAALATMHPMARTATQVLVHEIARAPQLLDDGEGIKKKAFEACAAAFLSSGHDLTADRAKFIEFLEHHGANVLDLAVSIIICVARSEQKQRRWGVAAKVASLVGAAALGAFFG